MFAYNMKSTKTWLLISLTLLIVMSGFANAQVAKNVWMYIYNSDGSAPSTGDIKITAYLQKNPSDKLISSNSENGWIYDINTKWGFYPNPEDAGSTNATVGDILVIECLNTSGNQFDGEFKAISGTLNENMTQQFGSNNFSLPVELANFKANVDQGIVNLEWSTESETINLGFNIYRSEAGKNDYQKINTTLIPGSGTTTEKHSYSYNDETAEYGKTYSYKIQNVDSDGSQKFYSSLSVEIDSEQVPAKFDLSQNYPNPFNPVTTINYSLAENSDVTLTIFNTLGEVVNVLVNESQTAGSYNVTWNGLSSAGTKVASGMYFYQIQAGNFNQVKKMMLSK